MVAVFLLGVIVAPGGSGASQAYAVPAGIKVAVVRSQATIDWLARHKLGYDHVGKSAALETYLRDRGWDVTRIGDAELGNLATLKTYDVVVLPYVFAMDPAPSRTLLRYVAEGGGLVSALGSPRVAPSYDVSPTEVWTEHWVRIMNYEGWEWGPLSEAYQAFFIDDNFTPKFDVKALDHPIVSGVRSILQSRGLSSTSVDLVRDPGAGLELVTTLQNNTNAKAFANFRINDSAVTSRYAGTYPAGLASEYLKGRSVYFYFSPMDFLPTYNSALYGRLTPSGIAQGEVAGAYLESALEWAATDDGKDGAIVRDARTSGVIDIYQDGIYTHQYLGNQGNVSTSGTLTYTVRDPRGVQVASWTRYMTGVAPGTQQRYSHQYVPGKLLDGEYVVQVKYVFTYPDYALSWTEEARVRRGQGTGIKTAPVAPAVSPDLTNLNVYPNPVTPNGDGWADWTYFNYTLNTAATIDIKVYDIAWNLLAVPAEGRYQTPGFYSFRYDMRTRTGGQLPDGVYWYSVQARNSAGSQARGGMFFVSRGIVTAPALGTSPRLSSVWMHPNPFYPTGGGSDATTAFCYTVNTDAYVTIKVLDWRGEAKTVVLNGFRPAGRYYEGWNGKNDLGRLLPPGNYRYYIFASGGGAKPHTDLATGVVTIK